MLDWLIRADPQLRSANLGLPVIMIIKAGISRRAVNSVAVDRPAARTRKGPWTYI